MTLIISISKALRRPKERNTARPVVSTGLVYILQVEIFIITRLLQVEIEVKYWKTIPALMMWHYRHLPVLTESPKRQ